jgi:hypothetical protein
MLRINLPARLTGRERSALLIATLGLLPVAAGSYVVGHVTEDVVLTVAAVLETLAVSTTVFICQLRSLRRESAANARAITRYLEERHRYYERRRAELQELRVALGLTDRSTETDD